jgi:hypothetical protein
MIPGRPSIARASWLPVAYALHGSVWRDEVHHYLDLGALLIRDEVGYRPWAGLREEAQERFDADLWSSITTGN